MTLLVLVASVSVSGCQNSPAYLTTTTISAGEVEGTYFVQIVARETKDGVVREVQRPSLVCVEGEPAEICAISDDRSEGITAKVFIPKRDAAENAEVEVTIRKDNAAVSVSRMAFNLDKPTGHRSTELHGEIDDLKTGR